MASSLYTAAKTISGVLSQLSTPPMSLIGFREPRFEPLHVRAHVPRETALGIVHTYVVCDGRIAYEDGRDRCARRYEYGHTVLLVCSFDSDPDLNASDPDSPNQPASAAELDELMELSEWIQDQLDGTKQFADSASTVNVTNVDLVGGMPAPDLASAGVWHTGFEITSSVGIR